MANINNAYAAMLATTPTVATPTEDERIGGAARGVAGMSQFLGGLDPSAANAGVSPAMVKAMGPERVKQKPVSPLDILKTQLAMDKFETKSERDAVNDAYKKEKDKLDRTYKQEQDKIKTSDRDRKFQLSEMKFAASLDKIRSDAAEKNEDAAKTASKIRVAFNKDFTKNTSVKEYKTTAEQVSKLETILDQNDGDITGLEGSALKFLTARMFNGARPTDKDVAAFGGAQSYSDAFNRFINIKASDRVSAEDAAAFRKFVGVFKRGLEKNKSNIKNSFYGMAQDAGFSDEDYERSIGTYMDPTPIPSAKKKADKVAGDLAKPKGKTKVVFDEATGTYERVSM